MSTQLSPTPNPTNSLVLTDIAKLGDFFVIEKTLQDNGIIDTVVAEVKQVYGSDLTHIDWFTSADFVLFAILDLYDRALARHSLAVLQLLQQKITRPVCYQQIRFLDLVTNSGINLNQFWRGCIFHDLGKIKVPNFILNNSTTNQELLQILLDKLSVDKTILTTITNQTKDYDIPLDSTDKLNTYLKQYGLRAIHLLPVKYFLSADELTKLSQTGFTTDQPLHDIIKIHEAYSKEILTQKGLIIESELAGSHHDYQHQGSSILLEIPELHFIVDAVELIRLADMTEALSTPRSYTKNRLPLPKILSIILDEATAGKINLTLAYLWIKEEVDFSSSSTDNLDDWAIVKEKLQHLFPLTKLPN